MTCLSKMFIVMPLGDRYTIERGELNYVNAFLQEEQARITRFSDKLANGEVKPKRQLPVKTKIHEIRGSRRRRSDQRFCDANQPITANPEPGHSPGAWVQPEKSRGGVKTPPYEKGKTTSPCRAGDAAPAGGKSYISGGSQRFFHHGTLKGCLSLGISRTESPDAVMPEDGQVVFFLPGKEGIRNSP